MQRGTITQDKFRANTPWQTNEFGFYDLNHNAIFIMDDLATVHPDKQQLFYEVGTPK